MPTSFGTITKSVLEFRGSREQPVASRNAASAKLLKEREERFLIAGSPAKDSQRRPLPGARPRLGRVEQRVERQEAASHLEQRKTLQRLRASRLRKPTRPQLARRRGPPRR